MSYPHSHGSLDFLFRCILCVLKISLWYINFCMRIFIMYSLCLNLMSTNHIFKVYLSKTNHKPLQNLIQCKCHRLIKHHHIDFPRFQGGTDSIFIPTPENMYMCFHSFGLSILLNH